MYTLATVLPSIELTLEINVSAYQVPFSILWWRSKWSTITLLYIGYVDIHMTCWLVAFMVSLSFSTPTFHLLANSLALTFEWRSLLLTLDAILLFSRLSVSFLCVQSTRTEPIKKSHKDVSWYTVEILCSSFPTSPHLSLLLWPFLISENLPLLHARV